MIDRAAATGSLRRRRWLLLPVAALSLVVVVPVAALVVGCWLAGWTLQPVQTASMEPAFPAGSLLVVEPIDASEVEVGMAVVFEDPVSPGRLVAHRISSRQPGEALTFRTRGDANQTDDPFPINASAVRGQVRWRIVGLGTVVSALQWPTNAIVLIGLPAAVLAATEWRGWRRRRAASMSTDEAGAPMIAPAAMSRGEL